MLFINIIANIIIIISSVITRNIFINGVFIPQKEIHKVNNSYYFKGKNPNNYISFNSDMWRIVSFNEDGTIKIIKNDDIGKEIFDSKANDFFKSKLRNYLNNKYYLSSKYIKMIKPYNWDNNSKNLLGLISIYDYIYSSENCKNVESFFEGVCNNNYIYNMLKGKTAWTITKDENSVLYIGNIYYPDNEVDLKHYIFPALYLKEDITLIGTGTASNPYKIKEV